MEKTIIDIYSKVETDKLLHKIVRVSHANEERKNLIESDQFIQCSLLNMNKGKTFKSHKHIWKPLSQDVIAQESWIVIKGKVKCFFYDLDDSLITIEILSPGDASFTLEGGHNYEILEDDSIIYEYKTGPYQGQELDKVFLEDSRES